MSLVPVLLIGAAAGLAFAVTDMLVAPVIRGWRADRQARIDARRTRGRDHDPLGPIDTAPAYTVTLGSRLFDNLVAAALIGGVVLAFHLAGFV